MSPLSALRPALPLAVALFALLLPAGAGEPPPWSDAAPRAPVDFAAEAADPDPLHTRLVDVGRELFARKFTAPEGAGRPMATQAIVPTKRRHPAAFAMQRLAGPDAASCAACHNDPVVGGAGDFIANAFVSEGFESADFDTTDPQFSNERGTVALHGAGLIELLAREMTADLHARRRAALARARRENAPVTVALATKGVSFGRLTVSPDGIVDVSAVEGVDTDLTIRPFSQKGVFSSLRQFTVNAANTHHGLQAAERFGRLWTGSDDFDEDGHADELGPGDVSALVAFQASLPPPGRARDLSPAWQQAAARGEALFGEIGCASCHRPTLPLASLAFTDPGPLETAGTLRPQEVARPIVLDLARTAWARRLERDAEGNWLVPLFGDLKRHAIAGKRVDTLGQELLAQRFVERNVFLTTELWGAGSTAPYGHRGDLSTLSEVIAAHGGAALEPRNRFLALARPDRDAIVAFLKSLVIDTSDHARLGAEANQ